MTCHPAASSTTHISLIDETGCTILMHSTPPLPKAQSIRAERENIRVLEVPEVEYWFEEEDFGENTTELFTNSKSLAEVNDDPYFVIHTSGSTGIPKKIVATHAHMAQQSISYAKLPSLERIPYEQWRGLRVAVLTPISIAAGAYNILGLNVLFDFTIVLPPPRSTPVTADILNEIIIHGNVQACLVSPKILPQTCENTTYLQNLRRLQVMSYIGAPCPSHIGSIIIQYTPLTTLYGSSEANILPTEVTDTDDFGYIKLHPMVSHRYRHVCQDYYELVVLRNDKTDSCQGAFKIFPHMTEYPMQDLFSKHPTKPDLWLYCGRMDDLIVSIDADRFLPNPMESMIQAHPGIAAAVVCEQRNGTIALVIETKERLPSADTKEELLREIWPTLQEANKLCPIDAEFNKGLVLFTDSDRPLPRGTKGYAQRAQTLDLYKVDIDTAYQLELKKV